MKTTIKRKQQSQAYRRTCDLRMHEADAEEPEFETNQDYLRSSSSAGLTHQNFFKKQNITK
jgi:hypothetical protein